MKVTGFGDFLMHFSPIEKMRFHQADLMQLSFTGAEANVCMALGFWGEETEFVTRLPEHSLSKKGVSFLKSNGVGVQHIAYGTGRMGVYFLESGHSLRSSQVIYDRGGTLFANSSFQDYDWDHIFSDTRIFYLSGITPSLSDNLLECCKAALAECKKRNIPVFYDVNLRPALCNIEKSREIFTALHPYISHLIGKIDMNGKYILPGFIDVHIHGACGVRVSDENPDIQKILNFEATQGVTGIAFSLAVNDFEQMLQQIDVGVFESSKSNATKILAINAEGPFLSKKYRGCMPEDHIITPDIGKLNEMIKRAKGLFKIVAVAPEAENAVEFIRYAVKNGITVSIGHTDASYEETMEAINEGATQAVHTFNAMRPFNHREPGVLGAVLTDNRINCEVICDYTHLHPVTVDMIYKLKGPDHMIMVSDSVNAAGMEMDEFIAEGKKRTVKDGVVRLPDGTIAGSAMTLLNGVQHLIKRGIPIADVSKMASYNPAKSIKMDGEVGSIAVGKCADLVVLDKEYNVDSTFINGVCVYNGGTK